LAASARSASEVLARASGWCAAELEKHPNEGKSWQNL
jgi:hypothetical protein